MRMSIPGRPKGEYRSAQHEGTPTSTRRLALCVDDFGLHEGVNGAVAQLAALGRINAIGCMVGAPAWGAGSARLHEFDRERIDVGLHLDLTEFPLQPRSGLRDLILSAYTRRLDEAQLLAEINAQLDAFEQTLNRAPDYIDGHQHVHQLPVVRDALLRALRQRYPSQRPWLRSTRRARHLVLPPEQSWRSHWKPNVIEALGSRALTRLAQRDGYGQNQHLLGVHDFSADVPAYRRLMAAWLHAACDGDLLMCHPSLPEGGVNDGLLNARVAEWTVLCEPEFGQALARAGIVLAPISRILAAT